jgi:hypothetical protein
LSICSVLIFPKVQHSTGKALPIKYGCVSLNNSEPVEAAAKPGATCIALEIQIPAGRSTFKAWFKDADGRDLAGAYYLRVTRI